MAKHVIEVGDMVAFSAGFLRSIGEYTGKLPLAMGTVVDVKDYGSLSVATIDWGDDDVPVKVNSKNLVRKDRIAFDV